MRLIKAITGYLANKEYLFGSYVEFTKLCFSLIAKVFFIGQKATKLRFSREFFEEEWHKNFPERTPLPTQINLKIKVNYYIDCANKHI